MSQGASTYTWQLPSRCLSTGTLASRLMRSIRPLPPRGITMSTYWGSVMSSPTTARSVVCTSCTPSTGRPESASACSTSSASALFDSMASEPPRRMQALPLLMARLAASMVTLGRLSNTIANTPIGTRIWPTRMPLGCCTMPLIWPITSGMAASCSHPRATVSMALGVSRSRSTIGADRPAAPARSRSIALAACSTGTQARNKVASVRRQVLRCAASARAIAPDAARACRPSVWQVWAMVTAFMAAFSHAIVPRRPGTAPSPAGAAPARGRSASRVVSGP